MENWRRFRAGRGERVGDAVPLDGLVGEPGSVASLVSPQGLLRLELVAARLEDHGAEFVRVDGRAGRGVELALIGGDGAVFCLARPIQPHASGLTRLAYVYSVLARSRDAVIYTDAAAAILGASPRWLDLYGLSLEQVLGRNPRLVNARQLPGSFFRDIWRDLTDRRIGSWSGELVNRRASGDLVRVWQTITAFRDAQSAVAGYLGLTRDLTQQRELLERLVAANRALGPQRLAPVTSRPLRRLYFRSMARSEAEIVASSVRERGLRLHLEEEGCSVPTLADEVATRQAIGGVLRAVTAAANRDRDLVVRLCNDEQGANEMTVELTDGRQVGEVLESLASIDPLDDTHPALGTRGGALGMELQAAQEIAGASGGRLHWEELPGGDLRVTLRLPRDGSRLLERVWAAVVFDPDEGLWPAVSGKFRAHGIPAFVAHRAADLRQICEWEMPSLIVLEAGEPMPAAVASFRIEDGEQSLVPGVCWLRLQGDPPTLVVAEISAPPVLSAAVLRLIGDGGGTRDGTDAAADAASEREER